MLALGSCSGGISRYRHPCVTAVGSGGERGGHRGVSAVMAARVVEPVIAVYHLLKKINKKM